MIRLRIDHSMWASRQEESNHRCVAALEIVQPDLCVLHEVHIDATSAPLKRGADPSPGRRFLQHVRHDEVADGFRIHGDAVSVERQLLGPVTIPVGKEHVTLTTGSAIVPAVSRCWFSDDRARPNEVALQRMRAAARAWKVDAGQAHTHRTGNMTNPIRSLLLTAVLALAGPQMAHAAPVTMGFDAIDLAGRPSIQVGDFYTVAPDNLGITFGRLYDDPIDAGPGTVMDHSDVYAKRTGDVWGNLAVGQQFLRSARNCIDDNLADFALCNGEDPVVEFNVADGFDSLFLDFFIAPAAAVIVRVTSDQGISTDTELACAFHDWCLGNRIRFAGVGSKVQFLGAVGSYGIDNITMDLHTTTGTVPEPASFGLAGLSLLGLVGMRRRAAKR